MATPTFVAFSGTAASQNGIDVPWPTTGTPYQAGDVGLLIIQQSGGDATLDMSAQGWKHVPGSPVTDIADATGSKLSVLWKVAGSASEPDAAMPDGGDHQQGRIFVFRGVDTTKPIHVSVSAAKATASTSYSYPALETTRGDCLVVLVASRPNDNAGTTFFGAPSAGGLDSITEPSAAEWGTTNGNGGGVSLAYGPKASAGSTGSPGGTLSTSLTNAYIVVALQEPITTRVHYVLYPAAKAAPTAAQIKAGQDVDGTAAVAADFDAAPTGSGTYTFAAPATGLTPGTSYRFAFVWTNGTIDSNVAVTDAFTTALDGTAAGVTLTATASLITGSAAGQVNATAAGATLPATASLVPGAASGGVNASAAGATLTATASLVAGSASGQVNATAGGATLSAAASLITGAASGAGEAAGVTLTATASLTAGAASSEDTADGALLTAQASLIAGSASGASAGTAGGVTVTASASLVPGAATGQANATAAGQTLPAAASLVAGAAAGQVNATAAGQTLTATASLSAGAASGGTASTGPGVTLTATASLVPGAATGVRNATAAGATVQASASLLAGAASGAISATAGGVVLQVGVVAIPGAATAANDAPGVVIQAAAAFIAGAASGQAGATAAGVVISITAALVPGAAFGPTFTASPGFIARGRPRRYTAARTRPMFEAAIGADGRVQPGRRAA